MDEFMYSVYKEFYPNMASFTLRITREKKTFHENIFEKTTEISFAKDNFYLDVFPEMILLSLDTSQVNKDEYRALATASRASRKIDRYDKTHMNKDE